MSLSTRRRRHHLEISPSPFKWEVSVVDGECLEQRPTESHHCALCLQNIYARQLNTSFPRHPTTNTRLFSTVKDRSLGPEIRAPVP
ncbi:hypothetical protein CesoFtcFv8_002925 [Champsocephalus esox]|uniref:Uncharacterized protein n=1 Tax=Champsocephalus esox TaxID=159716 RepID=A0AAN8CYZ3_9TELE|nr:hypothetical protein CesoFtcFv8_002925 [Champsocephalus esox]